MHAKAKMQPDVETLIVPKQDLVNAWLVLEKLVVSSDKIGGFYSAKTRDEFTEERRTELYAAIGKFVCQQVLDDANRFRLPLGRCLPDDEAEALSDEVHYWQPENKEA